MKNFKDIHKKKSNKNLSHEEVEYINALYDLKKAFEQSKHTLFSPLGEFNSSLAKRYYENAFKMGSDKFFSSSFVVEMKKLNKDFETNSDTRIVLINNLKTIINELDENETTATTSSVNGMGDVQLPDGDMEGSGDIVGAIGSTSIVKQLAEPVEMKHFKEVHEKNKTSNGEVYFPIVDLSDPSKLLEVIASSLSKKHNKTKSKILQKLTVLNISYNGLVEEKSLNDLGKFLNEEPKKLKKEIDKIIDINIQLVENMQVELVKELLENYNNINESILGRALGAVGGFFIGPKIGKIISKVLGLEKGKPLYNVLTSRVVSAALAQELTKNLI